MAKYSDEINGAYDDILGAGTLTTMSRVASTYNAAEGTRVVTSVEASPCAVVNLPASTSLSQQFENRIIQEFKKGKIRFFYVAAKGLTFEPEPNDLIAYKSKVWELVGATDLDPAGDGAILYIVAARASTLTTLPTVP